VWIFEPRLGEAQSTAQGNAAGSVFSDEVHKPSPFVTEAYVSRENLIQAQVGELAHYLIMRMGRLYLETGNGFDAPLYALLSVLRGG
jgi:hypothetical protein